MMMQNEGTTTVIIQARMGSTRLPGKMLKRIGGEPLIAHILYRAKAIAQVDEVILATSTDARDEPLAQAARDLGVAVARGPEEDVLARFFVALELAPSTSTVVRVCGDAPLFDPISTGEGVALIREHDADLVIPEDTSVAAAYHGAGVISRRALEWTRDVAASDDLRAHEHVTAFARDRADQLRTVTTTPEPSLLGAFHLSIDTAADLEAIRRIYGQLYRPGELVDLRDAVALVRSDPALASRRLA